jgi:hypothetical protein
MILLRYLRFRFRLWICIKRGHRWIYSQRSRLCSRCRIEQQGTYRPHIGKKERARRVVQMAQGQIDASQVSGGQPMLNAVRRGLMSIVRRNRAQDKKGR